jgi:ABC-type transport system involved in cytochrome bd biosynthesis fused ATPase/permease subunit
MKIFDKSLVKLLKIIFIVDFFIIILLAIFSTKLAVINTQFAFVSSLLVTIASFHSFKNQVKKRASEYESKYDRDEIDKIEDRFDLYSEDEINEEPIEDEKEVQRIIKEEKQKAKANTVKNTVQGLPSYLSLYRVMGYVVLLVGFFYLLKHELFDAVWYLVGFLIVPLTSVSSTFAIRKDFKEE